MFPVDDKSEHVWLEASDPKLDIFDSSLWSNSNDTFLPVHVCSATFTTTEDSKEFFLLHL
jgi:hypothetical protein